MKNIWIAKAVVQKGLSWLPWGHAWNTLFQKYVTKGYYLTPDLFALKRGQALDHLAAYAEHAGGNKLGGVPRTALEIGTGWYPVVPISLYLAGVERIYSVDIAMLTTKPQVRQTVEAFLTQVPDMPSEKRAALESLLARWDSLSLEQVLDALHITYIVGDARRLPLPDQSVDLVNSNNTFEHIYPHLLKPILTQFQRVCASGGVQSHFIDMTDHFAHFDRSITVYHFLRFSNHQWAWIDNSIQPQSRLRYPDYKALYAEVGVPIHHEFTAPGRLQDLRTVPLDPRFAGIPEAENAITHVRFISKA